MSVHVKCASRPLEAHRPVTRRVLPRLAILLLLCFAGHAFHSPIRVAGSTSAQGLRQQAAFESEALGSKLRAELTKDSLRTAVDKFMEARVAYRAAGRPGEAIDALTTAAATLFTLGEYRRALRLYTEAADESRRLGDQLREHEALNSAGRAYSYLGDNDRARRDVSTVLNYCEQHDCAHGQQRDRRLLAAALNNMGEVFYTKGLLLKALAYFERSLKLWSELGDGGGEALARLNLGYASSSSGNQDNAAAQFEQSRELARASGDRTTESLSLSAEGVVKSLNGQEQAALELHLEALNIARTVGDRQSEAVALNGLAQAYEGIGKKLVALDYFEQALRLFLENGSLEFAATSEYRIAKIYRLNGDIRQALAHYGQCIALGRRVNKKRIEAYALTDIAALYLAEGRQAQTRARYNQILEIYRQVGDRRGQALVLNSIGHLVSGSGDKTGAATFYNQALTQAQAAGDRETEAATLYSLAVAARDGGDLDAALDYAGQSVQLVENSRAYVTGPDLRSSYVASVHKHYGLYVDLLMLLDKRRPGRGYAAEALLASERSRARSLVETLAETGTDMRRGAEPGLLERERSLQQMLRTKAEQRIQLSSDAETEADAVEAARELRQLTAEYQVVQAQIREQNPHYAALTQPQPVKFEEIQAELRNEDTVLLEYELGEEKSYLWMVTASTLDGYELPGRAALEAAAREVYGLLTSRQPVGGKIDAEYQARVAASDEVYEEKALALSRMLLGPVAPRLGDRRLLIVAEGVLQYVPFEALPVPDAGDADSAERPPLNSRHEIVSVPSMSALIRLRRERSGVKPAPALVAVLADPVYETHDRRVNGAEQLTASAAPREAEEGAPLLRALEDFDGFGKDAGIPRLRHTSDEAEAIMALAPSGRTMMATGFAASRETAMSSRLSQYQIIHFAAHGLVNSEHPELSGIILSLVNKEGQREDGFLQLHDIYSLDLPAELVVLSACNTALGEDVKGEGLVGLTRAFLHAGSKGVVTSLWKVDDAATAELMRHFYKAMLEGGQSPAAALRFAKEEMRRQKRWRAPYYWAGFVMQGEYRQHIKTDDGRGTSGFFIAVAAFFSCVGLYVLSRLRARSAGGAGDTAAPKTLTLAAGSPRPIECPDERL